MSDYDYDEPICSYPCSVCQPWAFDDNGDELPLEEAMAKWEAMNE